ncbi:MAG: hypothetical protein KZQ66_19405 [Candidatus Thiodiazotropha sp. (ex Lucinoma aequizonata)]|nr:hypothetical protein [Candidatus Thiodiazotropha sp. (ex Lucinoma aequizonata)]MCU7889553.1 hypothetical protein [Candidatus Thiodiazotropha sp. (ex Lucinoma aequizonata)]MCU7903876.1 hypothetical protein [Candidatus Thiodiazotropha sp. (ex Lucinoma aequizonata)]MCU7909249.1 hypothetical protein [Candidatus Thiodiazotropha sp. (ex Lucinoma aequizonata)]
MKDFGGLGSHKIFHEIEDTLASSKRLAMGFFYGSSPDRVGRFHLTTPSG